jgi:tetratricopeptide (TPR) repeat protein
MTRLEQLQAFFNEDPNDPFNIYALALEYQKTDTQKALDFFNRLIHEHENYIPTYYHLAKLYAELGNREKSRTTFEQGIQKAKQQKDNKALRELQSAHQELLFEDNG